MKRALEKLKTDLQDNRKEETVVPGDQIGTVKMTIDEPLQILHITE